MNENSPPEGESVTLNQARNQHAIRGEEFTYVNHNMETVSGKRKILVFFKQTKWHLPFGLKAPGRFPENDAPGMLHILTPQLPETDSQELEGEAIRRSPIAQPTQRNRDPPLTIHNLPRALPWGSDRQYQ